MSLGDPPLMPGDITFVPGPVRTSWSEEELHTAARQYMLTMEGSPKGMSDEQRDRWHEKLGLLTHFLRCLWTNSFE